MTCQELFGSILLSALASAVSSPFPSDGYRSCTIKEAQKCKKVLWVEGKSFFPCAPVPSPSV